MSQSPLARSTRKSLPAFAHPPSRLSRTHSNFDLDDSSPATSPSSNSSQNAFATPPRSETPIISNAATRYRNAGTSTPTPLTPTHMLASTPKISYSPFAASTPPAGLSKSTSIPFDMAGSARAGRKAEEDIRIKSLAGDVTPVSKRKRIIRKKPFWQRLSETPRNMVDAAIFQFPTRIEEIFPPVRFANPIALALHTIHFLLLAPLFTPKATADSVFRTGPYRTGVDDRWGRIEEETKVARIGFIGARASFMVTFILLAVAVANSVYLFTRFRTYDMHLRSAQDTLPSPHASPVSAPKVRSQETRDDHTAASVSKPLLSNTQKYLRFSARVFRAVWKWSSSSVISILGIKSSVSPSGSMGDDSIQSLRVWEPPEFCLAFFCALPPSSPLLSYLLTTRHPFITPLLHLITTFLLSHLAASFAQLVKDRMLLSAEVMREYDRRFVYKRIFGSRVDRGVGTDDL